MPGDPNIYGSLLAVGLLIDGARDPALATAQPRRARRRPRRRRCSPPARAAASSALLARASPSASCVRSRDPLASPPRAPPTAAARPRLVGALAAARPTPAGAPARRSGSTSGATCTVESRFELYDRALRAVQRAPAARPRHRRLQRAERAGAIGGDASTSRSTTPISGRWSTWARRAACSSPALIVGRDLCAARRAPRAGGRRRRARPPSPAALATLAVFNLFIDGFYQRHFWVLLGVRARAAACRAPCARPARDAHAATVARRRRAAAR